MRPACELNDSTIQRTNGPFGLVLAYSVDVCAVSLPLPPLSASIAGLHGGRLFPDQKMRDLSDLALKPSDFPALQTLCAVDTRFPKDFAAWEELIALATREAHALGLFPPPLLVDPGEFETWCKRGALLPTIDGLRAYAIVRRGQVTNDSLASWLGAAGSAGEPTHQR